jgi:anti-sigma factor RsiW
MQHPDEGLIHTWLDGELPADEASLLEAHVAECPECSAKVAEARGLVAASSRIVSALDLVPSGVVPAASPKRRPWYASSQLRAAAAVVIVAGASFLVMQNRDKGAMDRIMSTPAAAPSPEAGTSAAEAARDLSSEPKPAADVAASAPATVQQRTETARRLEKPAPASPSATVQANEAQPLAGRVAGVSMERTDFARQPDSSESRRVMPLQVGAEKGVRGGVARGVEGPARISELRKVRSDTTQSEIRTVLEVSPGVEVTLTDVTPPLANLQMRQKAAAAAAAAPPPSVAAAPERDAADAVPINTISWTDRRGHKMTLTGRMPTEQLELARQRLPEDQR